MRLCQRFISSQSGMSIVGLLVVSGAIIVVLTAAMQISLNNQKVQRGARLSQDFGLLSAQIRLLLNNEASCISMMGNQTFSPPNSNESVVLYQPGTSGVTLASEGQSIQGLKIKKVALRNVSLLTNAPALYQGTLKIEAEKKQGPGGSFLGGAQLSADYLVSLHVNASGVMDHCFGELSPAEHARRICLQLEGIYDVTRVPRCQIKTSVKLIADDFCVGANCLSSFF